MVRVLRGHATTRHADAERTADLLTLAGATGEPGVRVWTPRPQVAFGRRDRGADGYAAAKAVARDREFLPTERQAGERAVTHTGSTVAFARAEPVAAARTGARECYDATVDCLQRALWRLGAPVQRGDPGRAFCPGDRGLSFSGKVAGVAQRIEADATLVAGMVVVDGAGAVADVLAPVYEALGLGLDPDAVGSVAGAGGPADPATVRATLERALVAELTDSPEVASNPEVTVARADCEGWAADETRGTDGRSTSVRPDSDGPAEWPDDR